MRNVWTNKQSKSTNKETNINFSHRSLAHVFDIDTNIDTKGKQNIEIVGNDAMTYFFWKLLK